MGVNISAPVGPWNDKLVTSKGGNKKTDIKAVQKMLIAAAARLKQDKFNPGKPDGKIGRVTNRSNTLKAIAEYETKCKAEVNMRLDPGGAVFKNLQVDGAPLPPKKIMIDGAKLKAFMDGMLGGHVKYGLGKKASPLTIEPTKIKKIDCSGFVQYLLYTVTGGTVKIKAGSWHQNKYFEDNRFEQVDYKTEASKRDNVLRLGYFFGGGGGGIGHIWFVLNAETIESHGSKGANRRSWSTSVLTTKVERCYVIGNVSATASRARAADHLCTTR